MRMHTRLAVRDPVPPPTPTFCATSGLSQMATAVGPAPLMVQP